MLYMIGLLAFQIALPSYNMSQLENISINVLDKYCFWCGAKNPDSASTCQRCGHSL